MNQPHSNPQTQNPTSGSVIPGIDVALLPNLIEPETLRGQTVIVVDVLRATTTIIHALHHGARQVLPQPSIEQALAAHQSHPGESVIGGERGGQIVDGFHHGNSPLEYTADVISGKTLILATTNGTVAMERCRLAKRILIGAMVNLESITRVVQYEPQVTVLCSGTDRLITSEDVIFAGALVDRLVAARTTAKQPVGALTDNALIALNHWQNTQRAAENGKPLVEFFRTARGGKNLVKIGYDRDIAFASQIDTLPVVPELNVESWSIRLPE